MEGTWCRFLNFSSLCPAPSCNQFPSGDWALAEAVKVLAGGWSRERGGGCVLQALSPSLCRTDGPERNPSSPIWPARAPRPGLVWLCGGWGSVWPNFSGGARNLFLVKLSQFLHSITNFMISPNIEYQTKKTGRHFQVC